jgi:hypothetical protein
VDKVFLLPFSVARSLGRALQEVAEETGYSVRTIRRPGVSNEGGSFTQCSALRIEKSRVRYKGCKFCRSFVSMPGSEHNSTKRNVPGTN